MGGAHWVLGKQVINLSVLYSTVSFVLVPDVALSRWPTIFKIQLLSKCSLVQSCFCLSTILMQAFGLSFVNTQGPWKVPSIARLQTNATSYASIDLFRLSQCVTSADGCEGRFLVYHTYIILGRLMCSIPRRSTLFSSLIETSAQTQGNVAYAIAHLSTKYSRSHSWFIENGQVHQCSTRGLRSLLRKLVIRLPYHRMERTLYHILF